MNNRLVKVLATVSMLFAGLSQAEQSAPAVDKLAARAALQQRTQAATPRATLLKSQAGTAPAAYAGELVANSERAYPPSCLGNILPFGLGQNDPNRYQTQITLPGDPLSNDTTEQNYSETVTVTVFRVPCSVTKSAVVMEIDRASGQDGNFIHYPIFPSVSGGAFTSTSAGPVPFEIRLAVDPNTFFSTTYAFSPLYYSNVYIFENNVPGQSAFDYNQSFVVYLDNLNTNDPNRFTSATLPAYNSAQYPSASLSMPITGYLTGNWFDPAHGGEGIQTEVGEFDPTHRYIVVAWYTFDSTGIPYWLFGSASFNDGDNSVTISQVAYQSGGSFAGTGSSATPALWGSMTVDFPDCNTMHFSFQSTAGLPTGVPAGSGTRTWTRLTQINGLTCQ